ncbi:hypothetical protein BV25DRAFT_1825871 [Artomyces pyxidatus]|uniref:Uncharacterized protein n=1 Tax=Artomyces pyxidatus TaxID=48021 RepID=A0ACB8T1K0_9AGAM|nr:hypothetical protein BV25DRAFT_1825871 [Artomyces pyxidatus]
MSAGWVQSIRSVDQDSDRLYVHIVVRASIRRVDPRGRRETGRGRDVRVVEDAAGRQDDAASERDQKGVELARRRETVPNPRSTGWFYTTRVAPRPYSKRARTRATERLGRLEEGKTKLSKCRRKQGNGMSQGGGQDDDDEKKGRARTRGYEARNERA